MKQFRFFTIAMTLMAVFTTLGLAACGDDDEDSGEKTFYCTLKYEYPDDVSRSNITGMAIYITNPEGTETGFSAYNGEDWRTIFYTGEWSFRVRAK